MEKPKECSKGSKLNQLAKLGHYYKRIVYVLKNPPVKLNLYIK